MAQKINNEIEKIAEIQTSIAVIITKLDYTNQKAHEIIESVDNLTKRINSASEVAINAKTLSLQNEKNLITVTNLLKKHDKVITSITVLATHWRWLIGTPIISALISIILAITNATK